METNTARSADNKRIPDSPRPFLTLPKSETLNLLCTSPTTPIAGPTSGRANHPGRRGSRSPGSLSQPLKFSPTTRSARHCAWLTSPASGQPNHSLFTTAHFQPPNYQCHLCGHVCAIARGTKGAQIKAGTGFQGSTRLKSPPPTNAGKSRRGFTGFCGRSGCQVPGVRGRTGAPGVPSGGRWAAQRGRCWSGIG